MFGVVSSAVHTGATSKASLTAESISLTSYSLTPQHKTKQTRHPSKPDVDPISGFSVFTLLDRDFLLLICKGNSVTLGRHCYPVLCTGSTTQRGNLSNGTGPQKGPVLSQASERKPAAEGSQTSTFDGCKDEKTVATQSQ